MLATDNERIYEKALNLRSQGLKGKDEYVHNTIGYNYRMPNINAAIGLGQIEKIKLSTIVGFKFEFTDCFQFTNPDLASIENISFLLLEKYIQLFAKTKSEF